VTSPFSVGQERVVNQVCELLVPGSSTAGPVRHAGPAEDDELHAAIGLMAGVTSHAALDRLAGSSAFNLLRRLAIEAYYGGTRDDAEVLVVGSGAVGSLVATELADQGADVLLVETCAGPARYVSTEDDRVTLTGGVNVATRAPRLGLEPWYEKAESRLGITERPDWPSSQVHQGFAVLGRSLDPVVAFPASTGFLGCCEVEELILDGRKVSGVRYRDASGGGVLRAPKIIFAAGTLNTARILLRSNDFVTLDTPATRSVGRNLGLRPARLVYGLFDEPQTCYISAQHQEDGFVVVATVTQDPVSFAENLVDSHHQPLWGPSLTEAVARHRHWAGLSVMIADENTARIDLDAREEVVVSKRFSAAERHRLDEALTFGADVLKAAGAREVIWTGLSATHPHGGAPIADDTGRSLDVEGLYIADGSLVPPTLSVDPSLTILALALKVASHVAEELGQ
jgi:hypothetical protein